MSSYYHLQPKKFIFLLGIPGSGKTFYGKILSERFGLEFFQEIPAKIIKSFNFKCGVEGPTELDKKIFEENKKRAEYLLKNYMGNTKPVICDGNHILDKIWLSYRLFRENSNNSQRNSVLRDYEEDNIFFLLDKYSIFIVLLTPLEISIKRQTERRSDEPKCTDIEALKFVNEKLIKFLSQNTENCIVINTEENIEKNILKIDTELSDRFGIYL